MSILTELLGSALGGNAISGLAKQLGADEGATTAALSAALPTIVGGLARNANKSDEGRDALFNALEKDHDGGILDDVGSLISAAGGSAGLGGLIGSIASMFGGGGQDRPDPKRTLNGEGILKHVLGEKRSVVEQGVAKSSGLDLGSVAKLLPMVAPIVMGALGKAKKQGGLDAAGVAGLLNDERRGIEKAAPPKSGRGIMDLLDTDDDGSVIDDIANIGSMLSRSGLFGN